MASGQFELKNGSLFVLAEAAGGVYNGSQLRLICDVADDVSVFLKVTEDQRIGFMVPKDKLLELHGKLSKSGILLKHYRNHSILSPKACLGELCPKCEQDALGDAIEISPILNEKFKGSVTALNIGMNGCATACVASATDDIHIVGNSKGYKFYIGGRISGEPKLAEVVAEGIPRLKIGEAIVLVLDVYSQNKQDGESLSDVVSRLGIATFKDAIKKGGLSVPQKSSIEASVAPSEEEDIAAIPIEEASLKVAGTKKTPQVEELSLEAIGIEETIQEEVLIEEVLIEEVLLEEAPIEETFQEEVPMEELAVDEPVSVKASGGDSVQAGEIKELEIVDDIESSTAAAYDDHPVSEPINDELGEYSYLSEGSGGELGVEISEEVIPVGPDDRVSHSHIVTKNNKTSIQVRGSYVTVVLSDGSDFRVPFKTVEEGKVIEMQIEDESFIIKNIEGKIQVKYGDFEMRVPLFHDDSVLADEEGEVVAA